jgi:hypothetical protein
MEIDVADVPLVLDLAVWQQQDVVGVLRLTYPKGCLGDPLAAHEALTRAADEKLRRGDDRGAVRPSVRSRPASGPQPR